MAKFNVALKNLENQKKVAREGWINNTYLKCIQGNTLVRVKPNGVESVARIEGSDLLANDWKVVKS